MHSFQSILLTILFETSWLLPSVVLLEGRYTRDVNNFELLVPRKLTADGNFLSFSLGHFYEHEPHVYRRKKRSLEEEEPTVSYGVTVDGKEHRVDLWPNHQLLAPSAVVETRDRDVRRTNLRRLRRDLCHFVGRIRGIDDSKVAISTCDGLAGYISMNGERYFIEPLNEHEPNKRGQHLHMIYGERMPTHFVGPRCGTTEDWTEAWKKRLREHEINNDDSGFDGKRGLESVHRYVESLIVVDKKFLDHHRNSDIETYILTIMNMVSDYYHDASIGNQMDVVVVRIMYLAKEEEEIDLAINQDSDKTLESFCKWQQTVNPKDVKNPNHHDIAVLLTRYDLCADNGASCGLMGLAYVAAACSPEKACAINEDAGLILGIVVAHEIGHIMGCSHDTEEISGCKAQAEDESFYVMSPFVHLHTNVWSTCSKTFVTAFFDNDLGECLNDKPDISLYPDNNMLPGTIYDAKHQCQMEFPGSSVCKTSEDKFCKQLMCRTDPSTCMSNGEPPADGTKCGENKWCYDKKCVEIGERPKAINGGWGEWAEFSKCSRTCGGGVQIAERECNNPRPQHRGRFCMGERKKIKICSTEPCPDGVTPFRAVQCSSYNDKPFQDKLYHWKPFRKDDDPCSLHCINEDHVYVKLAPRATDGTPCKAGTKNMCISGSCRVVGCDYILDSDAVEDRCGVCKGDGTECKIVDQTYQGATGNGYVKVAVIFRGCRNIVIEELKPSVNTIAIAGPDEKKFYLNGDFTEMSDGVREIGGAEGTYSHPEPGQELLMIHGPLKENIVFFVVFYGPENVGYRFQYSEPTSKSNYQPSYHWEFVDWTDCSVHCGGGVESSEPKCIEEKVGLVSSSFCPQSDKPAAKTRKCNEEPCRTKWRVGKWGKCMACKNVSGIRTREVECVKEAPRRGADDTLVPDDQCNGKKPGTKELCNAQPSCQKSRRVGRLDSSHQLPIEMMRRVWLQTVGNAPEADSRLPDFLDDTRNFNKLRHEVRNFHKKRNDDACDAAGDKGKKIQFNVGSIVHDPIDPEQLKLIEIPLKQSHNDLNITDQVFEEMGDRLPDAIDEKNAKVYKGPEAAAMMSKLEHRNESCVPESV